MHGSRDTDRRCHSGSQPRCLLDLVYLETNLFVFIGSWRALQWQQHQRNSTEAQTYNLMNGAEKRRVVVITKTETETGAKKREKR